MRHALQSNSPSHSLSSNSIPCSLACIALLPLCTFDLYSLSYFIFPTPDPIPLPVKNQFDSKLSSVMSFCPPSLAKAYFSNSTPQLRRSRPLDLSCLCIWLQNVPPVVQLVALRIQHQHEHMITPPQTRSSCHLLNIHKSFCVITHYPYVPSLAWRVRLPRLLESFNFRRWLHLLYSCSLQHAHCRQIRSILHYMPGVLHFDRIRIEHALCLIREMFLL